MCNAQNLLTQFFYPKLNIVPFDLQFLSCMQCKMLRLFTIGALALVLTHACKKDCENETVNQTTQLLQLKSTQSQNLWFGGTAIFNPDSVLFIYLKADRFNEVPDTLPFTVNREARNVELAFPETNGGTHTIQMHLNDKEIDQLTYSTEIIKEECKMVNAVLEIKYNGKKVCTRCGDGRYNAVRQVIFKKNL